MPITAKLSRKFYEKLGDDVANELVEWFNVVDAGYRAEFRDLFEVHFSRFDAKLEQRLAEMTAQLRTEFERRFAVIEARLDQCATKADLEAMGTKFILWSFGFWIANIATVLGILKLAGIF